MKLVWAVELWAAEMSALDRCHSHLLNNIDLLLTSLFFGVTTLSLMDAMLFGDTWHSMFLYAMRLHWLV